MPAIFTLNLSDASSISAALKRIVGKYSASPLDEVIIYLCPSVFICGFYFLMYCTQHLNHYNAGKEGQISSDRFEYINITNRITSTSPLTY
ncbi:hypothetical protein [Scytonema sp. HK-05]|uniref:hypothetical protein n=1 Tax=Scytonema sp. HK-05 TaxID=1137095 RepID=UPI001160E7CA|nr:hypothetical protein [Scytonema sp. HK-05]